MATKKPTANRKRKIDEIRKAQKRKEKRTTVIAIVLAVLLGGGLIAAALNSLNEAEINVAREGVPAVDAGCLDVQEQAEKEGSSHVEGPVTYKQIPPSSGDHDASPLPNRPKFYDRSEAPVAERVVHNLEHGYVVVWYDSKLAPGQLDRLRNISKAISPKFLVMPWTRGDFDQDKHVVMTGWLASQRCTQVSGEAIKAFYDQYGTGGPKNKAPEPNAA